MKKRNHFHHLWLILAAYGVWFALLSGTQEVLSGKFWKMGTSLLLGIITYIVIERTINK